MTFLKLIKGGKADDDPPETVEHDAEAERGIPAALNDLSHLVRSAWLPVVEEGVDPPKGSKFGGAAWLSAGGTVPVCPGCDHPMTLFLQLNSNELPEPMQPLVGPGLVQMFYCTTSEPLCEVDLEGWEPFSTNQVLRRVPLNAPGAPAARDENRDFPPRRIAAWEEVPDLPNWEELSDLGHELSGEEEDALESGELPISGDKLGGWPYWVQGVEYPDCPDCGEPMTYVFQLDSEDNLPYMWGDVGAGHISICAHHPHRIGFGWACH